jgi:hypothetical protein
MFYFVVQYFRWLARVPGLPQFFDALLLSGTSMFHKSRLRAMEALEAQVLQLPGVRLKVHRLGGTEFVDAGGQELGHLHGHGLLDVAITRETAKSLFLEKKVRPHHVFPESKWVSFQLESLDDVAFALSLLEMAMAKNSTPEQARSPAPLI